MIGEKPSFNPTEEDWFKKGEKSDGVKLPENPPSTGEFTSATDKEIEQAVAPIGETDVEKRFFGEDTEQKAA